MGLIRDIVDESCRAISSLSEKEILRAAEIMVETLSAGGKIFTCGNGGSAAHAAHLTAELVGRFRKERRGLSSICLNADTATITAIANDYGYGAIFTRQLSSVDSRLDTLVAFTTSGLSDNVLRAVDYAKMNNLRCIVLTGRAEPIANCVIHVDSDVTARIQETHQVVIHLLCELVEEAVS